MTQCAPPGQKAIRAGVVSPRSVLLLGKDEQIRGPLKRGVEHRGSVSRAGRAHERIRDMKHLGAGPAAIPALRAGQARKRAVHGGNMAWCARQHGKRAEDGHNGS